MQPSAPPAIFAVLFPLFGVLFFVGLWGAICALLSAMSGWRGMAALYPCPPGATGPQLKSGFASRVGWVNYRGVLTFEAAPQGLIVRVMRLFPFHAPVLIPWSAMQLTRDNGIFFAGSMQVHVGPKFGLNREALDAIEHAREVLLPRLPQVTPRGT